MSVVLVLVFFSIVSASIDSQINDVANSADRGIQNVDKVLSSSEARSNYLKQEWLKIIQSKAFGQYVLPIHEFLKTNKQVFGYFLGIDYEISWEFFLALFFWFFLVITLSGWVSGLVVLFILLIIYIASIGKGKLYRYDRIYSFISNSKEFGLGFFSLLIFLLVVFLLSISHVSAGLANLISGIFSSETSFFRRLLYIVFGILIFLVIDIAGKFSKNVYANFKKKVAEIELRSLAKRVKKINKESDAQEAKGGGGEVMSENAKFAQVYLENFGKAIKEHLESDE